MPLVNTKVTLSSRGAGPNNEATRSIIVWDRVNEWDGTVKTMGRAHENHGLGHGLGPRKSWAGLTKTMGGASHSLTRSRTMIERVASLLGPVRRDDRVTLLLDIPSCHGFRGPAHGFRGPAHVFVGPAHGFRGPSPWVSRALPMVFVGPAHGLHGPSPWLSWAQPIVSVSPAYGIRVPGP